MKRVLTLEGSHSVMSFVDTLLRELTGQIVSYKSVCFCLLPVGIRPRQTVESWSPDSLFNLSSLALRRCLE